MGTAAQTWAGEFSIHKGFFFFFYASFFVAIGQSAGVILCSHQSQSLVCTSELFQSWTISEKMFMRLSRPHRYPSSRFPSIQGTRWFSVCLFGSREVFPKSIIQTLARSEESWTKSRELPTICTEKRSTRLVFMMRHSYFFTLYPY